MLWPETNRKLAAAFEQGRLPTMVYVFKQDYEKQQLKRPLHRHESICELLLVYEGEGIYTLEGKEIPCRKGSVILYNQGDLHEISANTDSGIGTYSIGIANLKKPGLDENCLYQKGSSCIKNCGEMFDTMEAMMKQMRDMEDAGEAGYVIAQLLCAAFIVMVDQLEDLQQEVSIGSDEANILYRIQNYFNQHFTETITLADAAKELGCSETYISHLFKRVTGKTPIQYVIRRRIGLAQTLLISTELSVTQIAMRIGYDNPNYFSTLFSKQVGMSPIAYRRAYHEESRGLRSQI